MVDDRGKARVLDFGLALTTEVATPSSEHDEDSIMVKRRSGPQKVTRAGALLGTPAYMAPEQFKSKRVDARTGQFSYCVALYEASYGELPFGHLRVLVDLARERGADERRQEENDREVVAIDRLVGQLVASSRVDFGALDRRRLDAVELAVRALERAGLDPSLLEATHGRIEISGDAALLGQALANLLSNAQDHCGGVAGVRVERRADTVGLGLSLVRRIAEAHDGTAWVADRPEGGASVGLSCGC